MVFLLGYFMMSANAGCFALAANFYPTAIRATGVIWVSGIGRTGAIFGVGMEAIMMGSNWSIIYIPVPVLALFYRYDRYSVQTLDRAIGAPHGALTVHE